MVATLGNFKQHQWPLHSYETPLASPIMPFIDTSCKEQHHIKNDSSLNIIRNHDCVNIWVEGMIIRSCANKEKIKNEVWQYPTNQEVQNPETTCDECSDSVINDDRIMIRSCIVDSNEAERLMEDSTGVTRTPLKALDQVKLKSKSASKKLVARVFFLRFLMYRNHLSPVQNKVLNFLSFTPLLHFGDVAESKRHNDYVEIKEPVVVFDWEIVSMNSSSQKISPAIRVSLLCIPLLYTSVAMFCSCHV